MSITINHSATSVEALSRPSSQQDHTPAEASDRLQPLPQRSSSLLNDDDEDDEDDFDDDLDDDSLDDFDDELDDDDLDDDLEDDFDDDDDF